jgi:hypothetical protein
MRLVEEGFHALYMDSDNIVLGPLLKAFSSAWDVQGLSDWVDPELLPTGKCLLPPPALHLPPLLLAPVLLPPLAPSAVAASARCRLCGGAGAASSAASSGTTAQEACCCYVNTQQACSVTPPVRPLPSLSQAPPSTPAVACTSMCARSVHRCVSPSSYTAVAAAVLTTNWNQRTSSAVQQRLGADLPVPQLLQRDAAVHVKDCRHRRCHVQTPVAGSELRSFWHEDQNRLAAMVNTTTPCQSTGAANGRWLPAASKSARVSFSLATLPRAWVCPPQGCDAPQCCCTAQACGCCARRA